MAGSHQCLYWQPPLYHATECHADGGPGTVEDMEDLEDWEVFVIAAKFSAGIPSEFRRNQNIVPRTEQ